MSLRDAEEWVPRSAVLCSASHRVTRNDDDGATHAWKGLHGMTTAWAQPTRRFCRPPLGVSPTEGPKARSGGTRLNSPSTRHLTRSRSMLSNRGERRCPAAQRHDATHQALNAMTQPAMHPTSCPNNQAPNIMPQQHQRCRCATLKNGFLDPRGFALLRTASLGMTMMEPPTLGRACMA